MKINVKGDTPMERLTNLTRGLLAVPKSAIDKKKFTKSKKQKHK
jgi:hypothetical protein